MIAIIGGTGVDFRGVNSPFAEARDEKIHTRWGSAHVTRARLKGADDSAGREVVFLHRHADPDSVSGRVVPPHRVDQEARLLQGVGALGEDDAVRPVGQGPFGRGDDGGSRGASTASS